MPNTRRKWTGTGLVLDPFDLVLLSCVAGAAVVRGAAR